MKKLNYTKLLLLLPFFFACSGENNQQEEGDLTTISEVKTPEAVQSQIKGVFQNYIVLKNALVASDTAKAKVATDNLKQSVEQVDVSTLTEKEQNAWLQHKEGILAGLNQLRQSNDIKGEREAFSAVSDSFTNVFKNLGVKGVTIYRQHCPMALNNKGAGWLSEKEEIENPYFGNEMLECGENVQVLKFK